MGLNIARKALQSFDWWGEPVAPLNMRGQTVYTTSFAGLVGLAITISMLLFTKNMPRSQAPLTKSSIKVKL